MEKYLIDAGILNVLVQNYFTNFSDNLSLYMVNKKFYNFFKILNSSNRYDYGDKKIDVLTNVFRYEDSIKILYNSISNKLNLKDLNSFKFNFCENYIKNVHNGVYTTIYPQEYTLKLRDFLKVRFTDIFYKSNLNRLNLSKILSRHCNFIQTSLNHSLSLNSDFVNTIFYNSYLIGSNFYNCDLNFSNFWRCNLAGIKFQNCSLIFCNFQYPIITNKFRTSLENSVFKYCDLSNCKFSIIDLPWKTPLLYSNNHTTISYYLQRNYKNTVEEIIIKTIKDIWGEVQRKWREEDLNYKNLPHENFSIPEDFAKYISIINVEEGHVWIKKSFFRTFFKIKPNQKTFKQDFTTFVKNNTNNNSVINWLINSFNIGKFNILKDIVLEMLIEYLKPNINNVDFTGSRIHNCYFTGASMKGAKLVNIIVESNADKKEKVEDKNDKAAIACCTVNFPPFKKYNAVFSKVNLENSNLSHSNFKNVLFSQSKIMNSICINSIFNNSLFYEAQLSGTNFSYSKFVNCNFHFADLRDCDFTGADLTNVDFTGADLSGADFTNAILNKTVLRILFDKKIRKDDYPDFNFAAENSGLSGHMIPAGEPNFIDIIDLEIKLDGAKGLNNLQNRGAIMKHNSGCLYKWNENYTNLEGCILCNKK